MSRSAPGLDAQSPGGGPATPRASTGGEQAGPSVPLRLVLLAAPLLAGLSPVFLQEYAFTDDWSLLSGAHGGASSVPHIIRGGRPLLALAYATALPLIGTVANLAWLRLIAVMGLVALAWLLHRHLERAGWSPWQAMAVGVALVMLPGPTLFAAWATMFPLPWVLVLAGLAFSACLDDPRAGSARPSMWRLALATLLLAACFWTYQPAATAFWVFFAIAFLAPGTGQRLALALRSVTVFGAAAGLGFAAVAAGGRLFPEQTLARTALVSDPVAKFRWFVQVPLVEAWSLVSVDGSVAVAAGAGLVAATGLWLTSRRAGLSSATYLAAVAALLVAAYVPSLAVAENFASFRSEVGLSMMAALLAASGLRGCAEWLGTRERALTAALVAVAGAFLLTGANTVQNYIVRPATVELSWLRAVLAGAGGEVLIIPRQAATVAPRTIHDELGFPTVTCDWAVPFQVAEIMRERGRPAPRVTFARSPEDLRVAPGTTVVDTGWLTAMRRELPR
jgi:hypothetical protein